MISKPTRELADRAFKAILAKWSRDEWRIEGVERVHEFTKRVEGALDRVVAECGSGGRVGVVTSAGPIGAASSGCDAAPAVLSKRPPDSAEAACPPR